MGSLPDIDALSTLVSKIGHGTYPSNAKAISIVCEIFREGKELNQLEAFYELTRMLNALPTVVAEMPPGGSKSVALKVVERIRLLFDPSDLGLSFSDYRERNRRHLDFIGDSVVIFEDMKYDVSALNIVDIYATIDEMKAKFSRHDDLSDASKIVLSAQLDLLSKSVHRFQHSGVGPFRESVFSIYGRISIQLDGEDGLKAGTRREIIDDFLRIYGMAQAGGDLLRLGKPLIAGLLGAPQP